MGDAPKSLTLTIAGVSDDTFVQARTAQSSGNTYYATVADKKDGSQYAPREGVRISPLSENLPTSIEIDGVTIALEDGLTNSGKGADPTKAQNPKVSVNQAFDLPSLGRKQVEVRISTTPSGHWLLYVSVRGVSGGKATPKVHAFGASRLADL